MNDYKFLCHGTVQQEIILCVWNANISLHRNVQIHNLKQEI
jgi:hypothetical protein